MIPHSIKILDKLNKELENIKSENKIDKCEKAIKIVICGLKDLKQITQEYNFKSLQEEIVFFKTIKPQFVALFIYYNSIYKIEVKIPYGGSRNIKKYLNDELAKLKRFYDNNKDFCKYYKTKATFHDDKYFIRGNFDIKFTLDNFFIEADHSFSTTHDFKIAKIMAYDLIEIYLENKLKTLTNKEPIKKTQVNHKLKQTWTGSKVALIELLYALHSEGVFNYGTSDLKEMACYFESIFDIELGQFHRTFIEIRERSERTKFLNTLKETLTNKMDSSDEGH